MRANPIAEACLRWGLDWRGKISRAKIDARLEIGVNPAMLNRIRSGLNQRAVLSTFSLSLTLAQAPHPLAADVPVVQEAQSPSPGASKPALPSGPVTIICEVEGRTTLLEVLPNGTAVKKGDVLAELDSTPLRDRLADQEMVTEKARQAVLDAQNELTVAKAAQTEFANGALKAEEVEITRRVRVAREGEAAARRRLDSLLKSLAPQEYPVRNARQTLDELTVLRTQAEGTEAAFNVRKSTRLRALELGIERAQTTLKSHQAAFGHEQARRDKLKAQVARCTIKAPCAGRVTIASPANAASSPIVPGEQMREKQVLMRIMPDPLNDPPTRPGPGSDL